VKIHFCIYVRGRCALDDEHGAGSRQDLQCKGLVDGEVRRLKSINQVTAPGTGDVVADGNLEFLTSFEYVVAIGYVQKRLVTVWLEST
jgi:hypothetical protein